MATMNIAIIVAIGRNGEIGKDNKLLWNIPSDMKEFRRITTGNTVVMGRKTYESIGKPLPDRRNIILTRNKEFEAEGCEIAHDMEELFKLFRFEEDVYIMGGAEIYKMFENLANRFIITHVQGTFPEADTYFIPDISDKLMLYSYGKQGPKDSHKIIVAEYI
ncbi:dihydrofolate reductase [Bacillus phage BCD7]|uniref:dihydrofolate reductase n=1 Tax=Bacillus phage BCD7 TaxID=1136534 RepID=J9PU01_9CAUD|nr:dihydrofolate reductase [Bacillus phage BCD7]AEZ50558.1 dihydrofolate reductase [Bacillus phage BCD7]